MTRAAIMRARRVVVYAVVAGLATLSAGRTAFAADPVTSEALFRAGREAMDAGRYEEACARFGESQRLDPGAGTLLNLGECNEKLGKLASAWQAYSEAADALTGDDRWKYADGKRTELAGKLARVTIEVDRAAPAGCSVARDGVVLGAGAAKLPLPIDAGDHALELRCPGREPTRRRLSIVDGETPTLTLVPGTTTHEQAAASKAGSGMLVAGLVIGGAGLLSLVAGTATGILAIDRKSIVDDVCSPGPSGKLQCPREGLDAASQGATFATVSTATIIGGGIAVSAGIALIVADVLTAPKREKSAVSVHVMADSTGTGVVVSGIF